jgi:hypothetical protein
MFTASAFGQTLADMQAYQRNIPPSPGQRAFTEDEKQWEVDVNVHRNSQVLRADDMLVMLDGEIMSAEIDSDKCALWNRTHPEHQYADLSDIIAHLLGSRLDIKKAVDKLRVSK